MRTVKPVELAFRHHLAKQMKFLWHMTWHEDREISPGVPDLHYCFDPEGHQIYRVGWLELKAINKRLGARSRIAVEASQHQYIDKWQGIMPIHFLVRVIDHVYLIDGKYHQSLIGVQDDNEMQGISVFSCSHDDIFKYLPIELKNITRARNV